MKELFFFQISFPFYPISFF